MNSSDLREAGSEAAKAYRHFNDDDVKERLGDPRSRRNGVCRDERAGMGQYYECHGGLRLSLVKHDYLEKG